MLVPPSSRKAAAAAKAGGSGLRGGDQTRGQLQGVVMGQLGSCVVRELGFPWRFFPLERHRCRGGSEGGGMVMIMGRCGERREVAAHLLYQELGCRWRYQIDAGFLLLRNLKTSA